MFEVFKWFWVVVVLVCMPMLSGCGALGSVAGTAASGAASSAGSAAAGKVIGN